MTHQRWLGYKEQHTFYEHGLFHLTDHRHLVQRLRDSDRHGGGLQELRRRAAAHHHRPPGRAVPQARGGLRAALPLPLNIILKRHLLYHDWSYPLLIKK